jgi:hypothetical protein
MLIEEVGVKGEGRTMLGRGRVMLGEMMEEVLKRGGRSVELEEDRELLPWRVELAPMMMVELEKGGSSSSEPLGLSMTPTTVDELLEPPGRTVELLGSEGEGARTVEFEGTGTSLWTSGSSDPFGLWMGPTSWPLAVAEATAALTTEVPAWMVREGVPAGEPMATVPVEPGREYSKVGVTAGASEAMTSAGRVG